MSLLLSALKRAEQEKSARNAPAAGDSGLARPAAAPVSLELQPIGGVAAPGAQAPGVSRTADTHGAQALFEAKTAARAAEHRSKGPLLAAIGAIAVIVLAAGAYVWFSINALSPRPTVASAPLRPPAAPIAAPGSALPAPGPLAAAPPAATSSSPLPATAFTPPPPPTLTLAAAAPPAASLTTAPAPAERRSPARLASEAPSAAPAPAAPAAPEPMVQRSRAPQRAAVPAEVTGGYDALARGDFAQARSSYATALAADPTNVDALLGLATAEARAGRATAAAPHYRRVLQLDPGNATALAALASLADYSRPEAVESQLRSDLARMPSNAALHAALGNLYASQQRWTEAQSAYFEAHRLQPGSADVVYNLAVSLDHLGQGRLAREYYARAVESARTQATQFDAAAAARRLAELQP